MDFIKLQAERSLAGSLSAKDNGKKAVVVGWAYSTCADFLSF